MLVTLCILAFACHSKKKSTDEAFFPVSSFLKGDAAQAGSSGSPIRRVVSVDSVSDTALISQATFRYEAAAFTDLPDINSDEWRSDYEETKMYDDQLKTIILTYTAKMPDVALRREDVMLVPDEKGDTHVKTVIIDWLKDNKDSTIEKNMVWEAGKNFFIVTKVNKPGQPEKLSKLEVNWNGFPNQSSSRSIDK